MIGISSYGGYIPRYRLSRKLIYAAMGWMNAGNIAHARGEKAVANFDEDSITLAVSAGINALKGMDRTDVQALYYASTTLPYKERLNAGLMVPALGLNDQVRAADFAGGLKAGTTALLAALDGVQSDSSKKIVVTAADCRLGQPRPDRSARARSQPRPDQPFHQAGPARHRNSLPGGTEVCG